MITLKRSNRQGQTLVLGVDSEGLHIILTRKNHYQSHIVLKKDILPLEWKRAEIGDSAVKTLNGQIGEQNDFFVVAMTGFQTDAEKVVYCADGFFRSKTSEPEWIYVTINVTTYEGAFIGTRKYWWDLRRTEVQQIADIIKNYWSN